MSNRLTILSQILADAPEFQALVGQVDSAAALARIHLVAAPATAAKPYVILDEADEARSRRDVASGPFSTDHLTILLYAVRDASGNPGADQLAFRRDLRAVMVALEVQDLELPAEGGDMIFIDWNIDGIVLVRGSERRASTASSAVDELEASLQLNLETP